MPSAAPLLLLPGMGADARMFPAQLKAFASARVISWLPAKPADTLATYAARLARANDPGQPCFLAGTSFGGMIALELAHYLPTLAVFLIGSCRSPSQLPHHFHACRPLLPLLTLATTSAARRLLRAAARCCRPISRSFINQFADADPAFLRWAAHATLCWSPTAPPPAVPVFHIHGGSDRILPCRRLRPDRVIPTAGHLLAYTHATQVNAFLRTHMQLTCESARTTPGALSRT